MAEDVNVPSPSRRDDLCSAAVDLLAEGGSRALTHRALDARAGLPAGSTSYYFRTRRALLGAVITHVAETSRTAFAAALSRAAADRVASDAADVITSYLLELVHERRSTALARYALASDATTDPALRTLLATCLFSHPHAALLFGTLGAPEPDEAARDLISLLEGLLVDCLLWQRGGPETVADQRRDLRRPIHAQLARHSLRPAVDPARVPLPTVAFPEPTNWATSRAMVFLGYLDYFRDTLLAKLHGLTADELRSSNLASGWSPLMLLNHLASVERRWLVWGFEGVPVEDPWDDERDGSWFVAAEADLVGLTRRLREQAEVTRSIVAAHDLDDVGRPGERWRGAAPATLERVLFHLVQEYARHVGQLDVVRELLDGHVGE